MRQFAVKPDPRVSTLIALIMSLALLVGLAGCAPRVVAIGSSKDAPLGSRIVLNQLGFEPHARKVALLINRWHEVHGGWQVRDVRDGTVVLSGKLGRPATDPHTPHKLYSIDLSTLTIPGSYRIFAPGARSLTFQIRKQPYAELLNNLLRSFYLQRCGVPVDDPVTGITRAACHTADGRLAHNDYLKAHPRHPAAPGGWHDAGDYGKYVATTAVVITELLSRVEEHGEFFDALDIGIPESGNQYADVLDEMRVGLDWLLKMQRPDGAVYRKLSGKRWPKIVPPEADTQQRFIYGPSTAETAKAVAAFAIAARVYRKTRPGYGQLYLKAANNGWQWLQDNPDFAFDYRDGDDSGSGPYRANKTDIEETLTHDRDDRLAAAIELYLSSGDAAAHAYLKQHIPTTPANLYEWKDPSMQSLVNFHRLADKAEDRALRKAVRDKVVGRANEALERTQQSGWRMANHRFVWGSNKMAAQEGILMLHAWSMTKNPGFRQAAVDQFDYLLGRNPIDQSFVTGAGERTVQNIAHIYVRATGKQIPGLLVGGPNYLAQAKYAPANQGPMSYIDDARSYATNEYAIDYTSALIALIIDLQLK